MHAHVHLPVYIPHGLALSTSYETESVEVPFGLFTG